MLKLHVFNTGWVATSERHLYLGGGSTARTLPVLCFVIEHPRGLIVFDTGLSAAFAAEPRHYVGWLNDWLVPFRSSPGLNLSAQMRSCDLAPEDVRKVVLSHLHYDHTGELRAFPGAQLLLARQEWEAAQSPTRRVRGYLSREYRGLSFHLLDLPVLDALIADIASASSYGVDLMRDGSLIVVPTFGHTRGHQALLAFLPYGVVLLAGDAVYVREGYMRPAAQPFAHVPSIAWRSIMGLRALSKGQPDALILLSHDDSALHGPARPDIAIARTHPTPH